MIVNLGHFGAFKIVGNNDNSKMLLRTQPHCLENGEGFVNMIAGHKLLA